MKAHVRATNSRKATEDLKNRTLGGIAGELAQLVYLASTRDYNTGHYYHDGLAFRFGEEAARSALAACHQEVFRKLAFTSLEELVQQLDCYLLSTHSGRTEVLEIWKRLEPYRMTVPLDCDPLLAQLFFSNIKVALAILEDRPALNPAY
jgi:hypothetical protein